MRKKFTMLLALALCVFTSSVMAQTYYTPGKRTTTLEAGKQYFISVATYYGSACTNLLYNNDGTLAKSDLLPNSTTDNAAYLFTVEEVGDGYLAYIKNSNGNYIQADNLASTETKTGVYVIPYFEAKAVCCGNDVDACDESGNRIAYASITAESPIVSVQKNAGYTVADNKNGWRYINSLSAGVDWCTAFAFYEARELDAPFEVTTDVNSPICYTIKNIRANNYAEYDGAARAMLLKSSVTSAANLFYFTAGTTAGTYKIHNAATSNKCAATNSWTADGIDWYIKQSENTAYSGFAISKESTLTEDTEQAWNDYQGNGTSVAYYGGNDAGSVWAIEKYTAEVPTIKMSTESEKHLYFIKNDRVNKFANYVASGTAFSETAASNYGSYWYFVEKTDAEDVPEGFMACYIYNAANDKPVQNHSNGYMSAVDDANYPAKVYLVGTHESTYWGYVIYPLGETSAGWNDSNGTNVTTWPYDDAGSIWSIIPADKTEAQLKSEAETAKNNALAFTTSAINADYYSYADEAIATALKAVKDIDVSTLASATTALLDNKIAEPLNTLKATERGTTAPVAGEYIQLKNKTRGGFLNANTTTVNGNTNGSQNTTLWLLEEAEGGVKIKNVDTGTYVGAIETSKGVNLVDQANAAVFGFANQADMYATFRAIDQTGWQYGHMAGGNNLVGWEAGSDASQWVVSKVTIPEEDTYYLIECPFFEQVQGVKKALYSDGTNPKWKTLDTADKSFYWTVEKTETGYALKNANDSKYISGNTEQSGTWIMAEATTGADYTRELAGDGQVFIKIAGWHMHANGHSAGAGSGSNIVSWNTNSANSASAWKFVATEDPDLMLAIAALQNRIEELQVIVDNATGEIGYYKSEATAVSEHIATAQEVLESESKDVDIYAAALADLNVAVEDVDLNIVLPEAGKFYRFGYDFGDAGVKYVQAVASGVQGKANAMLMTEGQGAASIFYYADGKLLSYSAGQYVCDEKDNRGLQAVGATAGTASFVASTVPGKLYVYAGSSFHANKSGDVYFVDHCGSGHNPEHNFTVEEVVSLPVAVSAAGYATLYAPVALTPDEGVTAHTVTVKGEVAVLSEALEVIPAETGVILVGDEGTYNFAVTTTEEAATSALTGTFAKTYVEADAYVLAQKNDVVGLYKATKNQQEGASWLNNAFKAYLPAPANATAPMFSFDRGEGTTEIENSELKIENSVVIYDLLGRRVEKMEKGIYIVNGKKVVIK